MKSQNPALRTAIATAVLAGAGMTSFSALAASSASLQRPDAAARAEIQQTYRAERAACLDGSSTQDRSACLAEAAAARKEALAGVLGVQNVAGAGRIEPTEPDLMANALARCDAVPSDVRSDCERRVTGGDGVIVIGSVAEGVIVRELAPAEAPMVLAQADTAAPAAEPANTVVAEPTEPVMEAEPAALAAAPAQDDVVGAGLSEGETLVPTEPAPATSLMAEPALAEPAMTEPATTEPAMSEPAAVVEPAQSQPPAAIEAGPASGADPVAYPEWMAPIRFE
jgi:hypothetical protein